MPLFVFRDRFLVEGMMPERALLRLQRAGICVYNAKKIKKNQILFSVSQKDSEKVFAIYPNVCYNISIYSPFRVKRIGAEGLARYVEMIKKRIGLVLGALLFVVMIAYTDNLIFNVRVVGSPIYRREIDMALAEGGIKPFARYSSKSQDLICAKILSLDGVEYCSVQKIGLWAQVELRFSPFSQRVLQKESMRAKHTGELLSLTVLKGTPLKEKGDKIQQNEALIGNYFSIEGGGQVCVEPVGAAKIACLYEGMVEANTQEEAFAIAYLQLELSERDAITSREIVGGNGLYSVKIGYIVIETINW